MPPPGLISTWDKGLLHNKILMQFSRSWNDGEQFSLIGVASGGFRYGDGFYTFIQHEDVGLIW